MANRHRSSGGHALDLLREAFSAANIRSIAGIVDTGRVLLAQVRAAAGEPLVDSNGRDLLVRIVDVFSGHALLARLHVPANILWRKPQEGETVVVVTPQGANTPGGPVALYGDAGGPGAVPPWYGAKAGIYTPDPVRVESSAGDVEVEASGSGKKVKLGATATKGVNRQGDPTDEGTLAFTFAPGPPATLAIVYTPPGGPPQTLATGTGTLTLRGVTGVGSVKVKAED